MTHIFATLVAALLLIAFPVFADDEDAPLEEPAAQATAKPAAKEAPATPQKTEAVPAAPQKAEAAPKAPEAKVQPPLPTHELPGMAAPAAKAAAPAAPPAAAPQPLPPQGEAAPYQAVAESYTEARRGFDAWLQEASEQAKALAAKEAALKSTIEAKEAETTKLKLNNSKAAKQQLKELTKETKLLWNELGALDSERTALKKSLSRSATAKVRELDASIRESLHKAQSGE